MRATHFKGLTPHIADNGGNNVEASDVVAQQMANAVWGAYLIHQRRQWRAGVRFYPTCLRKARGDLRDQIQWFPMPITHNALYTVQDYLGRRIADESN